MSNYTSNFNLIGTTNHHANVRGKEYVQGTNGSRSLSVKEAGMPSKTVSQNQTQTLSGRYNHLANLNSNKSIGLSGAQNHTGMSSTPTNTRE